MIPGAHTSPLVLPGFFPVIAGCGSSRLFLSGVGGSARTVTGRALWIGCNCVRSAALPPEPGEEADSGGWAEFHMHGIAREFPDAARHADQPIAVP